MKIMMGIIAGCLASFFIVGGCAHQPDSESQTVYDKWQVKAKSARGYSPSPKRRTVSVGPDGVTDGSAAVAEATVAAQMRPLPQDPISINMTDIDVSVLLRALAKAANQNIIINEKVKGRANISIEQAPWDKVFTGILNTHGLTYRWEGDIIRIMTLDDLEAALKREEQKQDLRIAGPVTTRVLRIDYAEAGKMKTNLESFLSKDRSGKSIGSVMVDEHTNSLIVQALPEDIEEMLTLVAELDRPTPQILIEAHIVEATKNTAMELGVQWGGVYTNALDGGRTYTVGSGLASKESNAINIPSGSFASNFPASIGQGAGMTLGFLVNSLDGNILAAQLSALQKEGRANILSNPSITTLDNQVAIFESGREIPYQSVDGNGTPKTEFKKAVLLLEVTPHVIDGDALKMKIKTTKDEVDTLSTSTTPPIITKRAETTVILYDGQTTVIGGLNKEQEGGSESGVPGLKDIPLIGWLFKGTDSSSDMEDVLIFITPHILKRHIGGDTRVVPSN
ncbi:MAG: type IV pilus secretin PilQ [Pseudomonadota bacterium]